MASKVSAADNVQLRKELADLNQSLEANNIALEEAQALTHLGSWQWNVATNEIAWSDELYRIYGLKPQERQIGFDEFIRLIHPKDRDRVQGIIGAAFQTGEPFEFEHRIVLPNGKLRILQGKGKSDKGSDGAVIRMLGTSQDVTEQKITDQALHLSDERFKAVTAATSDIVYDFDLAEDMMWFNEALYDGYGYSRGAVKQTQAWWLDHVHPEDRAVIETSIQKLLKGKISRWEAEYRFRKHDGRYVEIRDRAYVIRDHSHKPMRMIGSMLDITKQKELERAKDEFISLASHQLRTPATAVKQYLGMMLGGYAGDLPESLMPFLSTAYNANERQLNIINDLLRTAQLESGQYTLIKEPHDVGQLLEEVIEAYKPVVNMRHQTLKFTAAQDVVTGVDAAELKVAFSNLLENASKYSPEGSTVTIAIKPTAKHVMVTIRDQGVGIESDNTAKIFEKFTRLDNELSDTVNGSGLGLYFVKKIIGLHSGTIAVKSEPQKGSTFTITLPR
ncbi:MAG: PAS domain-containing protein [Candidatus Saccharimonadales bacterium]